MCLTLGSGAKSDARNTVSALDGNAVRGECPFVGQRTVAQFLLAVRAHSLVAVQCLVRVDQALDMCSALLIDPCREVCLCLVDFTGPRRTVIHIHGNLYVIAILSDGRKILDLLQAAVPGLAGCHAAVNGDRAGIGDRAAAR